MSNLNEVQLGYIIKALNETKLNEEKKEIIIKRAYYWSTMLTDVKALEEYNKFKNK